MHLLHQVLSAAFQEVSEEFYARTYNEWMGLSWTKPGSDQPFYDWPAWSELEATGFWKPQTTIHIGTYLHAPFCDIEDGKRVGFEVDLCREMFRIIAEHYRKDGLVALAAQWVDVDIPEEEMGDGEDNRTMSGYLNERLGLPRNEGGYEMVFSGVFYGGVGGQFDFTHPTMRFWVGPVYIGRDNRQINEFTLGGDMDATLTALAKSFAAKGYKDVIITHTPNGSQIDSALTIARYFLQEEVYAICKPQMVPEIIEDINAESPRIDIYVGDLIQVQKMDKEGKGVDLEINMLGYEMSLAPYTLNPDYEPPEEGDDTDGPPGGGR